VGDRPLLARIDVSPFTSLEEKRGHVACQKSPRLRVHHVQTIMVDQHRLLLAPVRPTLPADLGYNASTDLTWERRLFEPFPFLTTARACYDRHDDLLSRILDLRQPEEREQPKVNPADVELIPFRLEFGRVRIVMMVVVELFAT